MHEPDRAGGALKASFVVGNVNHLHDVAIADRTTALPAQGRTQQPGQVFGPVATGTIAVLLLLRSDLTVAASRRHYSGEEKPLSFGQRGGRHTATGSRVRLLRGAWHRRLERIMPGPGVAVLPAVTFAPMFTPFVPFACSLFVNEPPVSGSGCPALHFDSMGTETDERGEKGLALSTLCQSHEF
uniref:Uncharacterized protein n=1 Tax=Anopheles coluzzii TaxID=1518534 RepID=A0A8W7PP07_ANOCL